MKTILCYGDSITWGYNPFNGTRYPFEQRWTGVLLAELGVVKGVCFLAFKGGEETSRELGPAYETAAKACGCHFFDASNVVTASRADGTHLEPDALRTLALALKPRVVGILGQ